MNPRFPNSGGSFQFIGQHHRWEKKNISDKENRNNQFAEKRAGNNKCVLFDNNR
jgi:hypothetical protein